MLKQDVKAILQRERFVPYRIHLANGKHYDVAHREVARYLGYRVLVFIGLKEGTHRRRGMTVFRFEQIARIEDLKGRRSPRRKKAS